MAKFIFVTGGVVSSLGKGISASALGHLLKNSGLKVFMQKFDPYINVDPGMMSPYQHGEVFVTKDGGETDLDLGHYERFIDVSLTQNASVTAGKIYLSVIEKERRGEYMGKTVQVIPHITNEIKEKVYAAARESGADVVITEIGGTVGDIESLPFIEAARQVRREKGFQNTCFIHNTLVPYLSAVGEIKTKPTQHSVKELRSIGIHPDIIILRTDVPVSQDIKDKIALFCDVAPEAVIESRNVEVLYEVVFELQRQKLDQIVCRHLDLPIREAKVDDWKALIETIRNLKQCVKIGLVGKYVQLHDAYLSVIEALNHAGYYHQTKVEIKWVDAEKLDNTNVDEVLQEVDGILVPGGFGDRAIEGKLAAIKYAREKQIPCFGICLGLQLATIEFARNVMGLDYANSLEMDPGTKYPIIGHLPSSYNEYKNGKRLRLGAHEIEVKANTKAYAAYNQPLIKERHRHRYTFNVEYKSQFEAMGMVFSGVNPQTGIIEVIELPHHPWYVACQFHPEFISRPTKPHPLFRDFIKASLSYRKNR